MPDGRSTVPLDLELCPSKEEESMEVEEPIEVEAMEWDDLNRENINTLRTLLKENQ
jgi:hypothetical protein